MENYTDQAYASLKNNKTEFFEGICTFNSCQVEITKRQDAYRYKTRSGRESTKCARFWGKVIFPTGDVETFSEARGGEVARMTGFLLTDERPLYFELGEKYVLPYKRK